DRALQIKPDFAEAWLGLGHLYAETRQFDAAIAAHQTALQIDPRLKFGRGFLLYNRANACDWDGLADDWSALLQDIRRGVPACTPFPLLATAALAADQLVCAKTYAAETFSKTPSALRPARRTSDRIRVAYLSADFRAHAVAFLIAGVFDHHDRTRFETIGLSYGADDGSEMRR